jgi:AmiR/NasT family two-component response regulator
MNGPDERAPCVLLGNLEPLLSLGMSKVLVEQGVDVVTADGQQSAIVDHVRRLGPDAVVLGLSGATHELSGRVRQASPDTKLILVAADESEMRVFDQGAAWPRTVRSGGRDALLEELQPKSDRGA